MPTRIAALPPSGHVQPFTEEERAAFLTAYIKCALWSSLDDDGGFLDDWAAADDLAPAALECMAEDCNGFIDAQAALLLESRLSIEQMGHDLWLTRNRHGAGYWDRGIGEVGQKLAEAARLEGNRDLYVGDDGLVHQA